MAVKGALGARYLSEGLTIGRRLPSTLRPVAGVPARYC
jgi:hypothetical protein